MLPRITIGGCHALRELPFLDMTEADFLRILAVRIPEGVKLADARVLFLARAIDRGHRRIEPWSVMDTLDSFDWR